MRSNFRSTARRNSPRCELEAPGWTEPARTALSRILRAGAGKRLPVVFDFDNTIVCGDIGEATLAVLVKSGKISASRLPRTICPPFRPPGQGKVRLKACADPAAYYEGLLAPTAHGHEDPTPLATGYVWAVEAMEGLRPLDVVDATQAAFHWPRPTNPTRPRPRSSFVQDLETATAQDGLPPYPEPVLIEVTPGKTAFPAPFFYNEMLELIAKLLLHKFDVWIVSASNVWSVRWMVLHQLNPRLLRFGVKEGLKPDHIVGISTLLTDRQDRLYKDQLLVRQNRAYAKLDEKNLRSFRLTSRLQFPVPTYSGKVACVLDQIGRMPWLAVGDGRGDHALLRFSHHRLWLARLEKPADQQATLRLMRQTGASDWIIQPILSKQSPGFINRRPIVSSRLSTVPLEVRRSVRLLGARHLPD